MLDFFHVLVDEIADYAMFAIDPSGRITSWNQGARLIFGLERKQAIGHSVLAVWPALGAETPTLETLLRRAADEGRVHSRALTVRHSSGVSVPCDSVIARVSGADGAVKGFVAIVKDLTRERAEEERFRIAVDASPSGMLMIGGDAKILLCNEAAGRLFGYSREQLLGADIAMLVPQRHRAHHDGLMAAFFGRPQSRDMGRGRELHAVRRDGTEFPVEVALNLIDGPEHGRVLVVVHDISERKRLESIRLAQELAQRDNQAKTELLSRMSHELRTPLNAMIGFADLLAKLPKTRDDRQLSAFVANILSGGAHLEKLLGDLSALNLGESRKVEIRIETVMLAEELTDTVALASAAVRNEPDVSIEFDAAHFQGLAARADPLRLRQIVLNLVSNAIKYNRRGGRVTILPDTTQPQLIGIAVRDTGVGIEQRDLERAFEPFERLGAENSRVEGSGLGLTIARQLAHEMHGRIEVTTRPGHGSTFTVLLPLDPALGLAPGRSAADASSADAPLSDAQALRVLYVEDNRLNVALMESMLRLRPGTVLRSTAIGTEALRIVAEWRPNLIIIDRGLPEMNGEEVLRALKSDPDSASIAVVICSASSSAEQIARLLAMGARSYWVKPIRIEQVLEYLDELDAARRQERQERQGTEAAAGSAPLRAAP